MAKISAPAMTTQDKQWQAECDARTLAEAEVIEADTSRMKAAQASAKTMAAEAQKNADAMMSVASGSSNVQEGPTGPDTTTIKPKNKTVSKVVTKTVPKVSKVNKMKTPKVPKK